MTWKEFKELIESKLEEDGLPLTTEIGTIEIEEGQRKGVVCVVFNSLSDSLEIC